MVGNWKWNLGLGLFAMIITLAFTLLANTFWTAFERSCYSFLLFYLIAFIPRLLLSRLSSSTESDPNSQRESDSQIQPDSQTQGEDISEGDFQPASFSEVDNVGRVVRQWSNE